MFYRKLLAIPLVLCLSGEASGYPKVDYRRGEFNQTQLSELISEPEYFGRAAMFFYEKSTEIPFRTPNGNATIKATVRYRINGEGRFQMDISADNEKDRNILGADPQRQLTTDEMVGYIKNNRDMFDSISENLAGRLLDAFEPYRSWERKVNWFISGEGEDIEDSGLTGHFRSTFCSDPLFVPSEADRRYLEENLPQEVYSAGAWETASLLESFFEANFERQETFGEDFVDIPHLAMVGGNCYGYSIGFCKAFRFVAERNPKLEGFQALPVKAYHFAFGEWQAHQLNAIVDTKTPRLEFIDAFREGDVGAIPVVFTD